MLKFVLTLAAATFATTVSSHAAQACQAEAQIIAPIARVEKSMTSCKVFIAPNHVLFFSSSSVCPLALSEIAANGVEVGLENGHDCKFDVGSELNGVVVRLQATGLLVLE